MKLLRTAFFGRTGVALSLRGLEWVLSCPGIQLLSVTCGRRDESLRADGPLHRMVRTARIPLLTFAQVEGSLADIDLVLSWSNPGVFPARFISRVRFGILNLHPAPLPDYRG